MTELDEFLARDHTGELEHDFFYEYSCVDDTFVDIDSRGERSTVDSDLALLPAQIEFMEDVSNRIVGYVGGFGSGKTFILVQKVMQSINLNPGSDVICLEPNHPLLIQILFPEITKVLRASGLKWQFRSTEGIYYVESNGQTTRIICKSMENTDRIIGVNACAAFVDEADVSKTEVAYKAFIMLLGRLRSGRVRQLCMVGTPEGYKAMYKIFVTEERGKLIKVKTTDNIFLPADFIDTLYEMYPPHLVKAYIEGEFVNMTSGSVFGYFDRKANHATVTLEESDNEIWLGGDFNSGGCITLKALLIKDKVYVFEEMVTKDTFETTAALKSAHRNVKMFGCFDATGNKITSNSSQSDLDILSEAGVSLVMGGSNPHLNDSILSVNSAFIHKKVFIDTAKCPKLTSAISSIQVT